MARKFRTIPGASGSAGRRGGSKAATHDVWAETETQKAREERLKSGEIVEHKDHTTAGQRFQARAEPKRQHVYKPPSGRTLLPHPGSSYNPSEAERKEAVALAHAELAKQEAYAKRIEAKQPQFMKRRRPVKRAREEDDDEDEDQDEEETTEAGERPVEYAADDADEADDAGDEATEGLPKKKLPKRKTTVQRNKDAEVRSQHVKHMRKKQKADLDAQIEQLDTFAAELKKKAEERAAELKQKKERKIAKSDVRVKRIAGVRYRLPAVHVLEEEDVKRNLRTQKIGESAELPMKERFQSLQERNWLGSTAPKARKAGALDKYRTFTKYTQ